jgi:catechol 2,3-dioxygenase-like lactoylglutathione lyase family enzyme
MAAARLEHVNVTVNDAERTAALLIDLFGWHVRWQGAAMAGGRTVHVGTNEQYIALYTGADAPYPPARFGKSQPMNHIAVVVDDLDAIEWRVSAAGLRPFNHGDYEPGRRFYFFDPDGIEYEVVSYAPARSASRVGQAALA